jgi:hypothetical protein
MMSDAAISLKVNMRKLWSDHVIWTRCYIIPAVAGPHGVMDVAEHLPLGEAGSTVASTAQAALTAMPMSDADAAAGRLLKNQDDIGNAIVPFYGQAAGDKLTALLKQHITIAVELITAAREGHQDKFASEDAKWTKNVEEIATFLSSANPNWPRKDVVDLLMLHLNLTKGEVVARLNKKWDDDVKAFDDIFIEILTVADTLSDGIMKQFPEKFR